mmetsp:Transcript_23544/g.31576  ORF Transcript_23544/g.31576 Transcript_23544/m.31576 type:complete len:152 (-) Transcript_23544:1016-1471(-)
MRASFHSNLSEEPLRATPAVVSQSEQNTLILSMVKKGFEREVAFYCLQKVHFHSVKAAVNYLQRTNKEGLKCHSYVESGGNEVCSLCKLSSDRHVEVASSLPNERSLLYTEDKKASLKTCKICFEPDSKLTVLEACEHSFCAECLRGTIEF